MFHLCSFPLCFRQATHHCIACHKSLCEAHLYTAIAQSSHYSGQVIFCEHCLREQRPFSLNSVWQIHQVNNN